MSETALVRAFSQEDLPTTTRVKRLQKEVVPFSSADILNGSVPYVNNPDPILTYVAMKDEEEYQVMERAETAISSSKQKRLNTLFSFDTEVVAANNSRRTRSSSRTSRSIS
jgi:hypothetical protein